MDKKSVKHNHLTAVSRNKILESYTVLGQHYVLLANAQYTK